MPYEILWALMLLVFAATLTSMIFFIGHARKKQLFEQKYRLRQLLHEERMRALEKDIPLVEIPSLEEEIFALTEEAVPEQIRRQKRWRTIGILTLAVSIGVSASFYLSGEEISGNSGHWG